MPEQKIDPAKVTKPIQLLAAWLIGLILIDGSFLSGAGLITRPDWASGALVIAAIGNVPLFLLCLFLLQTKFRPEMQEDQYYSGYLERRYSIQIAKTELVEVPKEISKADIKLLSALTSTAQTRAPLLIDGLPRVQINDLLPSYGALKDALAKVGIVVDSTFGSTSPGKTVPSLFIVAMGDWVDLSEVAVLVEVAKKFGLNGISYAEEDISRGRIYIGGYGYDRFRYLPIESDSFTNLNLKNITWDKLKPILTSSPELKIAKSQ